MKFFLLSVVGTMISLVSILLFVWVSASTLADFRYFFIVAYALMTIGLFFWASRSMRRQLIVQLGCVVAVLSVLVDQLLAFWFFPGLAKDSEPFEWLHIQTVVVMLLAAVCWYVAIAVLVSRLTPKTAY